VVQDFRGAVFRKYGVSGALDLCNCPFGYTFALKAFADDSIKQPDASRKIAGMRRVKTYKSDDGMQCRTKHSVERSAVQN
jgi:hypothetical protein